MDSDLASYKIMITETVILNNRNINAKENPAPEMIGENVFKVSPYRA